VAIYIDVIISLISVEIKEAMVLCSCKLLDEMTCISTFVNIGMHSVFSKKIHYRVGEKWHEFISHQCDSRLQ
jgi:hypothetical protein